MQIREMLTPAKSILAGWALKPVLHSRTKILRPRATDTGSLTVRRTVRSTAPVSFAPSRRGRGRRVSRSQVKVQTRRITGPAPRPRRCKRLRVGDMRRTFSNPALKNSLGSLGEAAIQSHAKRQRPTKTASAVWIRPATSGARCLPAKQCRRKVIILTGIAKNRKRKNRRNITYTHKKPCE